MKAGRLQAKDITDEEILTVMSTLHIERGTDIISLGVLEVRLSKYPPKVVLAKLRSMVRRMKLSAQCTCGCRGDFALPERFVWYPDPLSWRAA